MNQAKGRKKLHRVNSSYCSQSESMNDTASLFRTPSQKPVTEQIPSVLAPSTLRCKPLNEKDSSSLGQAQKSLPSDVIENESTSPLPMTGKLSWQTFSPFKKSCCHGVTNGCYELVTTRVVVEPVAYLFMPLDKADSWMGELAQKRLRLRNSGYYPWAIGCFDIAWTADVVYGSIVERIKMLWP